MSCDNPITKVTQIIQRADGSEARIVATAMFGIGLHRSIDVYVHRRSSPDGQWQLCSDRPHPNWREMSVDDYIRYGRSEKYRTVSHGEIFKVVSLIGAELTEMDAEDARGVEVDPQAPSDFGDPSPCC